MYLIKEIHFCPKTQNVLVQDGIRVTSIENSNELFAYHQYWGKTKIHLGDFADVSKLPIIDDMCILLSYINEYEVRDIGDNFKEFLFYVSRYEPENIEGYIIFIKPGLNMKHNGIKLFGRYSDELVVVLKDGQYIEFDGEKIEVISNHLMLNI